ncbi:MAG TPA: alcohol dehydrogenase catalytic domain-containing protein [Chloroflexi bacterium]|jgi:L-iditol 2-dehydrogenase|nr:alcohol dehydrogenase catalytic domain-containing protein [Chloroflexota bacterium]
MRALVKYAAGKGNVGVRDVPVRQPEADEVLIRVKYCGICGTDLHIEADEFPNTPPVVMGHEYCGTIVAVGEGVRDRWSVGDRVVGELHTGACGVCSLCRAGKPHICDHKLALGSKYHGAFAEYLTLPAWLVHALPDGIPWEVAGVTEPFAISAHCVIERGNLTSGQSVLISGAATMGLMATIWASRLGAGPIIVSGTAMDVEKRFPLAHAMGASCTVNVQEESLRDVVMDLTGGVGVDTWIECSGSGAAITQGIDLVKKTGRAVLIGLIGPETTPIPWNTLLYKEIDLAGCFSSPPSSWEKALAAEREEADKLRQLVSAIIPLEDWEEGFAMMRRGEVVKVLIDMEA